jgi:hypothetical protein
MSTLQSGLRDEQLALASVISAQTDYNVLNGPGQTFAAVLRATAIGTSLTLQIFTSLDNTNFTQIYASPAMTGAPRFRRVVFSASGSASDTDTAAVDATINKAPILEPYIRIRLIPSGSCTVNLDALFV